MIANANGAIVYIDDDEEDHLLFELALKELAVNNVFRPFTDSRAALKYLEETKESPFLILCDLVMPGMNGIELRDYIARNENLKKKAIPFIFLSTTAAPWKLSEAYQYPIQGFVIKGKNYDALRNQIQLIFAYWKSALHPSVYPSGSFQEPE